MRRRITLKGRYRDAALSDLIGIVSGNGPLKCEDHNRKKNRGSILTLSYR